MKLVLYEKPAITEDFDKSAKRNFITLSECGDAIRPPDAELQQRFDKLCLHFTDFKAAWCQRVNGLRYATVGHDMYLCFCTFLLNASPGKPNKYFQLCLPVFLDIIPASEYRTNAANKLGRLRASIEILRGDLEAEMGKKLSLHQNASTAGGCLELATPISEKFTRKRGSARMDLL